MISASMIVLCTTFAASSSFSGVKRSSLNSHPSSRSRLKRELGCDFKDIIEDEARRAELRDKYCLDI